MRNTVYLAFLILIINIYRVRSGAFVYGLYDDAIDVPFVARKSAFTFADPENFSFNVVNLYSVPTSTYLTLQLLEQNIDGMPFPPNITLSPDRGVDKPNANLYTSIGVSMPNSHAFVISNINTGLAILFCKPDVNQTNVNPMLIDDHDEIYWNNTMFSSSDSTYPEDGANSQIVSIARSSKPDAFETIPAVLYHTQQHIFRVLLMKVDFTYGYLSMIKVLFSEPNVVAGRPAVVSYEPRNFNSYIFAYAYQTGTFSWSLLVQTFDADGAMSNVTEYAIASQKQVDVDMAYVENDVVTITYQLVNDTHTSLRQVTINVYGQQILSENEVAAVKSTSATYAFATNVIPDSKLITIWSISTDNTIFNGLVFDSLNASNPTLHFSVPAADPSQAISRLIVAPFSSDSFAITQAYTTSAASFTNYYTVSSCDGTSGLREPVDCSQNNYACSCSCDPKAGYYNASDGISCNTVCGDNIVAGNETCDNTNDTNCISCTCAQNYLWSTTDSRCVPQNVVTPPSATNNPTGTDNNTPANTAPGSGWNNNYIAAILLCTAAAGAAIFLGVYFGKKRKAAGQKKSKPKKSESASDQDQQPQELLSDKEPMTMSTDTKYGQMATPTGSYIGLPKPEEIEMQPASDVIARNNSKVTATSAADKLNVPYGELKFITEIGAGAYGKVFIGEWQRVKVALKINTSATGADFEREAKLMVELRPHPNVVQMLGVSSDGPYPVMILEYCDGGSLDSKLFDTSKEWTVADQLRTVTGIAKGLYHLHRNQIVHRDISARNILMNYGVPKISDFGMSRFVDDTKKGSTTKSNVGPIRWMSPESLKYQSYSTKSDVWTFGLVIYEIVARQEPHADADQIAIGVQIRDQGATPVIPDGCDPCLKEIMQKCWQMDPESRPTMEDICDILDTYLENKKL